MCTQTSYGHTYDNQLINELVCTYTVETIVTMSARWFGRLPLDKFCLASRNVAMYTILTLLLLSTEMLPNIVGHVPHAISSICYVAGTKKCSIICHTSLQYIAKKALQDSHDVVTMFSEPLLAS